MAQSSEPSGSPARYGDHRAVLSQLRNFLAGQHLGGTHDRALLDAVIQVLFCRHHLEQAGGLPDAGATCGDLHSTYSGAWDQISRRLPNLFDSSAGLSLDPATLAHAVELTESFDLDDPKADIIGDAFELFSSTEARGQEGQFFTPQNAVQLLTDLVDPRPGERVIDPACGAGGFLSATIRHLVGLGLDATEATAAVFGIDKDSYLLRLAAQRLSFFAFEACNLTCADSLAWRAEGGSEPPVAALAGTFDVVLTNPPFGSKIVATTPEIQQRFDLGHKWVLDSNTNSFEMSDTLLNRVPPQVLFVERCLSLLRPGGRLGIVLPESLVSARSHRHVISWLRNRGAIRAVIGMPEPLFKTSGKGGTHTKTCLVYVEKHGDSGAKPKSRRIFMAEAASCGKDSRARPTGTDDLPAISARWRQAARGRSIPQDSLGYWLKHSDVVDDILTPRYYDPEVSKQLAELERTHDLVRVSDLVETGELAISSGDEVGAAAYGTGDIPFVRTSDISNWEIKIDPKQGISRKHFERFADRQDIRENDILMVRDGTYLIGTCALLTKYDTEIVFQSHIYRLRLSSGSTVSPYLLLAVLSSAPVQRQIRAKRFTQDIIDSLGNRILELILPIPRDDAHKAEIETMVKKAVDERTEARELARLAISAVVDRSAGAPR